MLGNRGLGKTTPKGDRLFIAGVPKKEGRFAKDHSGGREASRD